MNFMGPNGQSSSLPYWTDLKLVACGPANFKRLGGSENFPRDTKGRVCYQSAWGFAPQDACQAV